MKKNNHSTQNDLSYLSDLLTKEENSPKGVTPMAKKALFVIFALVLILFPKYTPYTSNPTQDASLLKDIFNFYFFISNQTFGIVHEGGHGVCYLLHCPKFITALNGTVFQILFPLGIGYYYLRAKNLVAWSVGLFFTGFTMHNTAWYISTAHEGPILPAAKSFLGVDAYHDFYYILDTLGILAYDGAVAMAVRIVAYGLMVWSVWRLYALAFFTHDTQKGG
jgi:hypothetical protein